MLVSITNISLSVRIVIIQRDILFDYVYELKCGQQLVVVAYLIPPQKHISVNYIY